MPAEILLGDVSFKRRTFENLDGLFKQFTDKSFLELSDRKRSDVVNQALLDLIQKAKEPCFLLNEVLHFIERVDQENILHHYVFSSFELWLNQFSNLSFEENLRVRAKIVGKYIPREEYQHMFPIGMGKVYPGSHFVTAHKSPDLDTTIASFWGFIDAFGAKVGDSLHMWNLPGGPPPSQIEIDLIFRDLFGEAVFTHLPKTRTVLSLSGNDLMTQKGMLLKKPQDSAYLLYRKREESAIVMVDDQGYYLGDFRVVDAEGVRQVLLLLNQCLSWFESTLHIELINLFANKDLSIDAIPSFIDKLFQRRIEESAPAKEFAPTEKEWLDGLLRKVMHLEKGISSTFQELGEALTKRSIVDFDKVRGVVDAIRKDGLFDGSGKIIDDRSHIFKVLAKIISNLNKGLLVVKTALEDFEVALKIKTDVFGFSPNFVTVRADVEEIRSKMANYQHLTVAYPDKGKFSPVGVIPASEIRKQTLGTVSLRDFSNRSEMTIPSYLEVISVIDHHKMELSTYQPGVLLISDAQSSNAIVAEQAFRINDRFSTIGIDLKKVDEQIKKENNIHNLSRLLQYKKIHEKKWPYYIHPEREFIEYLHFIYGILDDTDLLSKVSYRDVEVVASLINRLKSIATKEEIEVISLEDLPRDESFPKAAAKRILQDKDMYSLYKRIYSFREKEVEKNLTLCASNKPSNLFSDTKEQGKIARVGQTKCFAKNIPIFEKHKREIQKVWLEKSRETFEENSDIDLHLHMISTIVSAEEVYEGKEGSYSHRDELWIWAAPSEIGIEHLKRFLNAFKSSPQIINNELSLEFLGDNSQDLELIFKESFLPVTGIKASNEGLPIAVLSYKAGSINSRKAMITPYLPIISS